MLKQLTHVNQWVHDQDEALAFYTEKLGMELRQDVLMAVPGPPVFDEETAAALKTLVAKGAAGGLFFVTDDIQGTYDELVKRGVEFSQPPEERPYGVDAGFRDPSGNQMRVMQAG